METKFYFNQALIGVNDSLELDSYQNMADLTLTWEKNNRKAKKINVQLRVEGEVRIKYKGDIYTQTQDFPEGLMKIIKSGRVGRSKCTEILNNNWFEVYIYVNGVWAGVSDVVDGGWKSPGDVFDFLLDCANDYIRDYLENE